MDKNVWGDVILNIKDNDDKWGDVFVNTFANPDQVVIIDWSDDAVTLNRDSAIAAARAILKHYNVGVE